MGYKYNCTRTIRNRFLSPLSSLSEWTLAWLDSSLQSCRLVPLRLCTNSCCNETFTSHAFSDLGTGDSMLNDNPALHFPWHFTWHFPWHFPRPLSWPCHHSESHQLGQSSMISYTTEEMIPHSTTTIIMGPWDHDVLSVETRSYYVNTHDIDGPTA